MTGKCRWSVGAVLALSLIGTGCIGPDHEASSEHQVTFWYGFLPWAGIFFQAGGEHNIGPGDDGGSTEPHVCDGGPCSLADFPSLDGTTIRIWEVDPSHDSLSICKWNGQEFVCSPNIAELLAADGVTLTQIRFETTAGSFIAEDGATSIVVPKLPNHVCSSGTVSGVTKSGTVVTLEYPQNCR